MYINTAQTHQDIQFTHTHHTNSTGTLVEMWIEMEHVNEGDTNVLYWPFMSYPIIIMQCSFPIYK